MPPPRSAPPGGNLLFNERIQTRILQAIGRCTRSLQDFSAVVASGEGLPDYLMDRTRRSYLHPELQAELDFGIEQSVGCTLSDLTDNFKIFLRNNKEWEAANEKILTKRETATQQPFPAFTLQDIVSQEIEFQTRLWQADYESALGAAEAVLSHLVGSEPLKGYCALWHYLAGSAARLGSKQGTTGLMAKARLHFSLAKDVAHGIPWLVMLSRFPVETGGTKDEKSLVYTQLEQVEAIFAKLGTAYDREYNKMQKEIFDGLAAPKTSKLFENAHMLLGKMLGFDSGKEESDGSPDPWWIIGEYCLVFEDHSGEDPAKALDVKKARQVSSHPKWMKDNVTAAKNAECLAVLVTPVSTVKKGAAPHLKDVALWELEEFIAWAKGALAIRQDIRRTFTEPGVARDSPLEPAD